MPFSPTDLLNRLNPFHDRGPGHDLFSLQLSFLPSDDLHIVSFHGREGISQLYAFDVHFTTALPDLHDIEQLALGQHVHLSIWGRDDHHRHVSGIVSRFMTHGADRAGRTHHELRIVPRLSLLGRRKGYRIFQEKTVPEIVRTILGESNVLNVPALLHRYKPRTFCVQYDETELAFIKRLLAEEGIFFFFEHPPEPLAPAILFLADSAVTYPPAAGLGVLHYKPERGMNVTNDAIQAFGVRRSVKSGKSYVQEFDWMRPLHQPHAEATNTGGTGVLRRALGELHAPSSAPGPLGFDDRTLEVYDHYDDFENSDIEPKVAQLHLEQLRRGAVKGEGTSRSRLLRPGVRFMLAEHPLSAIEAGYAVISMTHEGRSPLAPGGGTDAQAASGAEETYEEAYKNTFVCVPGTTAYRPKRKPKAVHQSVETATIVGPVQHEIHTDAHGRVKVQFHWDRVGRRNEHSSCWMRVMQPWAGVGFGHQFIPRVGMEVLVTYVDGDTDKPIVLGSVYNASHPVPFSLPGDKTKSGIRTQTMHDPEGYNELSFDDRRNYELVHIHAQKDFDMHVKHARRARIASTDTTTVGGNASHLVGHNEFRVVGKDLIESIGRDHHITIEEMHCKTVKLDSTVVVLGVTSYDSAAGYFLNTLSDMTFGSATLGISTGPFTISCEAYSLTAGSISVSGAQDVTISTDCTGLLHAKQQVISADEKLSLVCGDSSIEITADEITITSPKVTIVGHDEAMLQGAAATVKLDGDATVAGGTTTLTGSGSSVVLDGSATIEAGSVALKSGSGEQHTHDHGGGGEPTPPPRVLFSAFVGIGRENESEGKLVVRTEAGVDLATYEASMAVERAAGHLVFELNPDDFEGSVVIVFIDDDGEEHHLAGPVDLQRLRRSLVGGNSSSAHRLAGRRARLAPVPERSGAADQALPDEPRHSSNVDTASPRSLFEDFPITEEPLGADGQDGQRANGQGS